MTMGFLAFLNLVLVSANATLFIASVSTDEDYIFPKFAEMAFWSDGDVFFKVILNSSKRSTNSTITMGFLLFLIVVLVSANSTSFTASVSTDEDYIDPKFAEMAFQSDGDVFSKRY